MIQLKLFVVLIALVQCDAARILAYLTMPSLSHQLTFRPLIEALVKQGHEVVTVTTDPAYAKGAAPANLTEIDLHDISYKTYLEIFTKNIKGQNNVYGQCKSLIDALTKVFEIQYKSDEVQKLLENEEKFDVVITESTFRITVLMGHVFKAPVILLSSYGFGYTNAEIVGAPVHLLYPSILRQRHKNLNFVETIREMYRDIFLTRVVYAYEKNENALIQKVIPGGPTMAELYEDANLFLVNANPLWESNRPTPPGTIFLGIMYQKSKTGLPVDLQNFLNKSTNGVIYISFGTAVLEKILPPERIKIFIKVFSELPYNVIWKWGSDVTPEAPQKIKFVKWLPQPELLKHPNLKLFITHGGVHSTYESIKSGVPFITIPMHLDQWFNADHCVYHGVTQMLQFEGITEEVLRTSIQTVITDDKYRKNIAKLNSWLHDQSQLPLERAVWWIEYAIRHKGTKHMRAPTAYMSWAEYLELELVSIFLFVLFLLVTSVIIIILRILRYLKAVFKIK